MCVRVHGGNLSTPPRNTTTHPKNVDNQFRPTSTALVPSLRDASEGAAAATLRRSILHPRTPPWLTSDTALAAPPQATRGRLDPGPPGGSMRPLGTVPRAVSREPRDGKRTGRATIRAPVPGERMGPENPPPPCQATAWGPVFPRTPPRASPPTHPRPGYSPSGAPGSLVGSNHPCCEERDAGHW
jgi:hypothetical protein